MYKQDPVEQKKREVEDLIYQKKTLEDQINAMKQQQENYELNPEFYDKLIALSGKLEDLKDVYDELQDKQARLKEINQCLANRIQLSQALVTDKDKIKQQLLGMLAEVDQIMSSVQ